MIPNTGADPVAGTPREASDEQVPKAGTEGRTSNPRFRFGVSRFGQPFARVAEDDTSSADASIHSS